MCQLKFMLHEVMQNSAGMLWLVRNVSSHVDAHSNAHGLQPERELCHWHTWRKAEPVRMPLRIAGHACLTANQVPPTSLQMLVFLTAGRPVQGVGAEQRQFRPGHGRYGRVPRGLRPAAAHPAGHRDTAGVRRDDSRAARRGERAGLVSSLGFPLYLPFTAAFGLLQATHNSKCPLRIDSGHTTAHARHPMPWFTCQRGKVFTLVNAHVLEQSPNPPSDC